MIESPVSLGALYLGRNRTRFRVWAPFSKRVDVHFTDPVERLARLRSDGRGYHSADVRGTAPGQRYFFRLNDGRERPDPASNGVTMRGRVGR